MIAYTKQNHLTAGENTRQEKMDTGSMYKYMYLTVHSVLYQFYTMGITVNHE